MYGSASAVQQVLPKTVDVIGGGSEQGALYLCDGFKTNNLCTGDLRLWGGDFFGYYSSILCCREGPNNALPPDWMDGWMDDRSW